MKRSEYKYDSSSYRDPSGHIFYKDGQIYRAVNYSYKSNYDELNKGFYDLLHKKGFLIPHKEVSLKSKDKNVYKIIKPEDIFLENYPYEWTFSQFKDAALLTLKIQKTALKRGFILKDATPFNIMFKKDKPVFIDTLSFDIRKDNSPWIAYRQFCEMFLGPLLLASKIDTSYLNLLSTKINGFDLQFVKNTLGPKNFTNLGVFTHVYLHSQTGDFFKASKKNNLERSIEIDTKSLLALTEDLESLIKKLKYKKSQGFWENYYEKTNYKKTSLKLKVKIIRKWIEKLGPKNIVDLGSNDGTLIKNLQKNCENYVCVDNDHDSIERLYVRSKKINKNKILPLYQDLSNTSPSVGFMGSERKSFIERAKFDCVLSLALIHHLSIQNNLSFVQTSELFSSMGKYLIIEFVPKEDSNVKIMLSNKKDIYDNYDEDSFESVYAKKYKILEKEKIKGTHRTLYLMEKL